MKAKRLILTVLLICLGICFIRISVSAAGADQKPEAPTVKVSNAAASGKITLSWDPVDGASSYKIYRATSVDGTYTRIYTTESTGFTNGTAVAGSTYCYYVVAVSSTGESSDPSKIVRRTCDLPRPEITLQNVESTGRIRISWGAVSGAVSYKVYTSPDSKSWTLLKNTTGTALTHGNCEAGKTYYYKVMAVAKSSAANSAYSKVKSRTCDLPQPTISSIGNSVYSGKITLSWNPVASAKEYKIYRSSSKDGTYTVVGTTSNTSFTNTSTVPGVLYYYKVKAIAVNTDANSALSAAKSRVCDLPRPELSLSNVPATGKIKITWNAIDGASSYKLYVSEDNQQWRLLKTTTKTSLVHTSTISGKKYYYKAKAIAEDAAANSVYSTVKYTFCDLPRPSLSVSNSASTGRVLLNWNPVEGALRYKIYRSESAEGTYAGLITLTDTQYEDKSGLADVTYYYKVIAIASDSSANSAHSLPISGVFKHLEGLRIQTSLNDKGKPRLTWNTVAGAVDYQIYRTVGKYGEAKLLSTTKNLAQNHNTAACGVDYYYQVIARDAEGVTICQSDWVCVTPVLPEGEEPQVRYVNDVKIAVYHYPDSSSNMTVITYMEEVRLGMAVTESDTGSWHRLFYGNDLYYVWMPTDTTKLTAVKREFVYKGRTQLQQEVIDLALQINSWDTFYTHDQSNGIPNADGSYGFDCSGLATYILNTVMQKHVPTYRLNKNLAAFLATEGIYNNGYNGAFAAYDVALTDIQPGDVIFFSQDSPYDHCGIYLGNNEFIHAAFLWNSVRIMPLSDIYLEDFACVRRYLPKEVKSADATMYVTTSNVYLYAERDDASDRIHTFKKGDKVTVLYSNNRDWVYVRIADGTEAFMLVKWLTADSPIQ